MICVIHGHVQYGMTDVVATIRPVHESGRKKEAYYTYATTSKAIETSLFIYQFVVIDSVFTHSIIAVSEIYNISFNALK